MNYRELPLSGSQAKGTAGFPNIHTLEISVCFLKLTVTHQVLMERLIEC